MPVSFIGGGNWNTQRKPVTSHWQTLSHNVVSSTPRHECGLNSTLVVIGTVCTGSHKSNYHTITTRMASQNIYKEKGLFKHIFSEKFHCTKFDYVHDIYINSCSLNQLIHQYYLCSCDRRWYMLKCPLYYCSILFTKTQSLKKELQFKYHS